MLQYNFGFSTTTSSCDKFHGFDFDWGGVDTASVVRRTLHQNHVQAHHISIHKKEINYFVCDFAK